MNAYFNNYHGLKPGTILKGSNAEYCIMDVLNEGTYCTVYLANVIVWDFLLKFPTDGFVAIKEFDFNRLNDALGCNESGISLNKDEEIQKFINEVNVLKECKFTPQVVTVFDYFIENEKQYYAMKYIDGITLEELIQRKGKLNEFEVLHIGKQLLAILSKMGSTKYSKIIHGDLNPRNIMLDESWDVTVIDFGLAKKLNPEDYYCDFSRTTGTAGFASPEQARGTKEHWDYFPAVIDIYSFGALVFNMLSGIRPPDAIYCQLNGFPIFELPDNLYETDLASFILKCTSPDPNLRFKTADECSAAFQKAIFSSPDLKYSIKGHFQKNLKLSDSRLCTQLIPVNQSIPYPETVYFWVWPKNKQGGGYEIIMTNGHFEDGNYGLVKQWHNGRVIDEHRISHGIPRDVMDYLISRGFLSTIHWEATDETSQENHDDGYRAYIRLTDPNGNHFFRQVETCSKSENSILIATLERMIESTCLSKEVQVRAIPKSQRENSDLLDYLPADINEITIRFQPSIIWGSTTIPKFSFKIEDKLYFSRYFPETFCRRYTYDLMHIVQCLNKLGIRVRDKYETPSIWSDKIPEILDIEFKSLSKGVIMLRHCESSYFGNMYGFKGDPRSLKDTVENIVLQMSNPIEYNTNNDYHTIPSITNSVLIDFRPGTKYRNREDRVVLKLNKSVTSNSFQQHTELFSKTNPREFKSLIACLHKMKIPSATPINLEPQEDYLCPSLTLSFYHDEKLLRRIEARQYKNENIGNTKASVRYLLGSIARVSPSFRRGLENLKKDRGISPITGMEHDK